MMHQKSLFSVRVNLTNFASFPKNDFKVPIKRKKTLTIPQDNTD